jgi:hypothetical protein
MSSLQHRLAAVTDTITNLIAQLRELDRLRERVRKAEISERKSLPPRRRKRVLAEIGHSQFENAEGPRRNEISRRHKFCVDWTA